MTVYNVTFSEPVAITYYGQRFDKETGKWKDVEYVKMEKSSVFYELSTAKKYMKKYIDKVVESGKTKIYSDGHWVNCGEIKLSGSNKTFITNTRMNQPNY